MKTLKIERTKFSPQVELSAEGEMVITGRSIMEDPTQFYIPIIEAVKNCESKKFTLETHLEYLNTSSTKIMLDLMLAIKDHFNSEDVFISWYYESDDEDMLDLGKDYETIISIPINFHESVEG